MSEQTSTIRAATEEERAEILDAFGDHFKLNPDEGPAPFGVYVVPNYVSDSPGYTGPVAFIHWGGSPTYLTALTFESFGAGMAWRVSANMHDQHAVEHAITEASKRNPAQEGIDAARADDQARAGFTGWTEEQTEAEIAYFKQFDWTWEYPGFLQAPDTPGYNFTVGLGETDARYTVQVMTTGGAEVKDFPHRDSNTREEVLAALAEFMASHPVVKATKFYGAHGFTETTTGGNCTAFERQHADLGIYLLLTLDQEAMAPETDAEPVTVGMYAIANGDQLAYFAADNGEHAIKKLKAGEWQQVEAPTEAERFRR